MKRPPAKNFQDLIVWQKAHQFVLAVYRYGKNVELTNQLQDVSKFLEGDLSSILQTENR